jgi:hypothetical protein
MGLAPLGVGETRQPEFSLFPIPARSSLVIQSGTAALFIEIYDLSGRLVQSGRVVNGFVDVASLASGSYVAKLTFEGGAKAARKFIKE